MGTQSLIAIKNKDETYDAVYCHFDGYPSGVGTTLKDYYKTEDKIRTLISFGGMSCLKDNVSDCEFYTKRGEKFHNYVMFSFEQLKQEATDIWCEYLYFFQDGGWEYVKL
jgi:hypothetical protein